MSWKRVAITPSFVRKGLVLHRQPLFFRSVSGYTRRFPFNGQRTPYFFGQFLRPGLRFLTTNPLPEPTPATPSDAPFSTPSQPTKPSANRVSPPDPVVGSLRRSLTFRQYSLIRKQKEILNDVLEDFTKMSADQEEIDLLRSRVRSLDALFLLLVVGEFNAGKSSVINALLGGPYLKESANSAADVSPTTRIAFPDDKESTDNVKRIPVDWLREINLVDTPDTNAVLRPDQDMTDHFIPKSDLIIFVTSCDKSLTGSELQLLQKISAWRKKVIVVVSKIDLLDKESRVNQVSSVVNGIRQQLGDQNSLHPARIFPVSSKMALKAKTTQDVENRELWQQSHFAELESYIVQKLDVQRRCKLKLRTPLGLASRLIDSNLGLFQERKEISIEDNRAIEAITSQMEEYVRAVRAQAKFRLRRMDNELLNLRDRGDAFFATHLRSKKTHELALLAISSSRKEKLRAAYFKQVARKTNVLVVNYAEELAKWVCDRNEIKSRAVVEYALWRVSKHAKPKVARFFTVKNPVKVISEAEYAVQRENLLKGITESASSVMATFNQEDRYAWIIGQLRAGLISTVALEAAALGFTALMTVFMVDHTGVVGAGALAVYGWLQLPYKTAKMRVQFTTRVDELRETLKRVVMDYFDKELEEWRKRLDDAIEPFVRFVKGETERVDEAIQRLETNNRRVGLCLQRLEIEFPHEV